MAALFRWLCDGMACSFFNQSYVCWWRASLVAQLVKNSPECRTSQFDSWVVKICWRRDRLPMPVFLGSSGAQLVKNLLPAIWETWIQSLGWEDPHGEGNGHPLQSSGLENSMEHSPWGRKGSDTTERLSLYCWWNWGCFHCFTISIGASVNILIHKALHRRADLLDECL